MHIFLERMQQCSANILKLLGYLCIELRTMYLVDCMEDDHRGIPLVGHYLDLSY